MKHHPEELLISSILRTGDPHTALGRGIDSDCFYVAKNEWRFIQSYMQEHLRPPSKTSFRQKFPEFRVIRIDDVAHWSDEVLKEHHRQTLLGVISESLDDLEQGDVDQVIKRLSGTTLGIQSKLVSGSTSNAFEDTEDLYAEVLARQERASRNGMAGIPFGHSSLDYATGGAQPGWLIIVGARLGQGKTWTLLRHAWEATRNGAHALFISLEQSKPQVSMRLHSFASHAVWDTSFSSLDLMKGSSAIDMLDYRDFLDELPNLVPGKFSVADTRRGKMSTAGVAALIESHQPSVVYLDYLTLLQMEGEGDHRSIGKLTADLKQIAETYRIPIEVAAQINRMGTGKEPPMAEHMAGSDSIGQDADLLITMSSQSKHLTRFRNAKFRHGPDGQTWYTEFKPTKGIFEEINGDRADEIRTEDYEQD